MFYTQKMEFYNKLAKLSIETFDSLPKSGKPNDNQWTILSTIVQKRNDDLEIVSLGTGTKCIGTQKMSSKGDILNDSHAEIICRRCFLLYLYSEMESCIVNYCSIFSFDGSKFTLKSDVHFYFFTTQVPCGDAAIFPKNAEEVGREIIEEVTSSKRLKLDIHRTGAKCLKYSDIQDPKLQGIDYHKVGAIRTKPGRGDPTLSISCSDKIARWCYLGVQGALLARILSAPIYLESITLVKNTLYSRESLERALNDRFPSVGLIHPYSKHSLEINQADVDFKFSKSDLKCPCPNSICWYKGAVKTEVAVDGIRQGTTKKKLGTKQARLNICKVELFRRFCELVKSIPNLQNRTSDYKEAKCLSADYQENWRTLKENVFKVWTDKNSSLLKFHVD